MIKVKKHSNCLFKPISYNKLFTRRRIHVISFICWFSLILVGTFLIGLSTNLYSKQFQYCQQSQSFCSRSFTLPSSRQVFMYVVIENLYQNNRMFLDSFSQMQLQGNIGNSFHCQGFDTYGSLNITSNAGGYRVNPTSSAFPCGQVMKNIFNDSIYLITSQGGAPVLDSQSLISHYNSQYKFINLPYYQLKQWIDIQSSSFVNYFTVSYTSTKYILVGKVSLLADTYQLIIKNNYPTSKGVLKKKLLISQVNQLGVKDPVVGFFMFISGIAMLFFHLFLCCRGVK